MTARVLPTCIDCGNQWPCVGLDGAGAPLLCHACRGQRTCAPCRDAAAQDDNDRDYDAQGNPR